MQPKFNPGDRVILVRPKADEDQNAICLVLDYVEQASYEDEPSIRFEFLSNPSRGIGRLYISRFQLYSVIRRP